MERQAANVNSGSTLGHRESENGKDFFFGEHLFVILVSCVGVLGSGCARQQLV